MIEAIPEPKNSRVSESVGGNEPRYEYRVVAGRVDYSFVAHSERDAWAWKRYLEGAGIAAAVQRRSLAWEDIP